MTEVDQNAHNLPTRRLHERQLNEQNQLHVRASHITRSGPSKNSDPTLYWDAKSPGLGLRVTPTGARAYIFESRLFGKTVRITIGDTRTWPLGQARTEAARLKTAIDDGIDPREQRLLKKAAHEARQAESRRKNVTVADAWAAYLGAHRTKWSPRHLFDHEKLSQAGGQPKKRGKGVTLAGPLAALIPLKLSDLTAETISEWLQIEARSRPTNAAQSYRKLRAFIRWCEDQTEYAGLIAGNAYSARAVREAVPRSNAKGDCLQREQLAAWFAAVRQVWSPVASTYLQALLLTGARREEMAALRWEDVDFQWDSLSIADKVEGARVAV